MQSSKPFEPCLTCPNYHYRKGGPKCGALNHFHDPCFVLKRIAVQKSEEYVLPPLSLEAEVRLGMYEFANEHYERRHK